MNLQYNKAQILQILDGDTPKWSVDLTIRCSGNFLVKLAKNAADVIQFPFQTTTLVALSVFSSASCNAYSVTYRDGSPLSLGLYCVCEQPPGAAKSRVLSVFKKPIENHFFKCKSSDGSNVMPFLSDSTPAAMEVILAENGGFFAILSAEQASVDSLFGISRDIKNNNDLILKAFSGDEYHVSARISRQGFSGLPYGSICVIAQDGTINSVLEKSNGQGIAERFLMLSEKNILGSRVFNHKMVFDEHLWEQYRNIVIRMVNEANLISPKSILDLPSLTISSAGWDLIDEFRFKTEPLLADGEKYSHNILRGAVAKSDIQIMKICALLYLADNNIAEKTIPPEYVSQAISIVESLILNMSHVLESHGVAGDKARFEAILAIFDKSTLRTERQIIQSRSRVLPFKNLSNKSTEIRQALSALVAADLVYEKVDRNGTLQYSIR